jgi:hypothetical protein
MGFGSQMSFISCWRIASWYLKNEQNQEMHGKIFLRAQRSAEGIAVPGPEMLDAVRALPADIDETQRDACNRFINAANNHLAKLGKLALNPIPTQPDEPG